MKAEPDTTSLAELLAHHGAAARPRAGLPVGPRANVRDDCALHDRGSVRGRRRDRAQRPRRPQGRARRSPVPSRVSRAHGGGGRRVRVRRRGARDLRQDAAPPSACVRRPEGREQRGADGALGGDQARGARGATGTSARPQRRARRRAGRVAGADARSEARQARGDGRLRLARRGRRAREGRRGARGSSMRPPRAADADEVAAEMGDLLFSIANWCRHLELDPETCLRAANARFTSRFRAVEKDVERSGREWRSFPAAELEQLWQQAKARERAD